ncbi:RNA-binding protein [Methanobrevibacter ruminantium]|uniref:RNA-binding protein n=1 Tax=Methanobrevibacter ruminantium TaxID=83816 RepID=UPI0026E9E651|nr:RNA-binding protein [Methanobrevibacter ruminantium]
MVLKIKKRYFLKKKKVKAIKEELGDYGSFINNKDTLEMLEAEDYDFILVNGEHYIIMINGKPYPTLKAALNIELDSKVVVVDMGAVRFVTKGADVMSPGIVDADESIVEDDVVIIVEETHNKPLAMGIALISGPEMVENSEGKAIKSLHFVGDAIWNLEV